MDIGSTVHAFGDDVLADRDAVALADLVRRRELSAVELAEAAIRRSEKVQPVLRAVAWEDYERALAAAKEPREGPFSGVPVFVKDNTHVKGMPTRFGSQGIPQMPAAVDGSFARQFLSLGFHVLGKSSMPEFGFNSTTEFQGKPPTCNPWNPAYSCGGSSGGAAALVAAGVVPLAHGNDGGGSIRIPAACCGLVGLKPSRGRLVEGEMARTLPIKIVVEGVLTRSVRDTAHFLAAAEQTYRNPNLPSLGLVEGPGQRRLVIGMILDSITQIPTGSQTRMAVEQTAAILESLGHRVEPWQAPIPVSFIDDFADYWNFLGFLVGWFGRLQFGKEFRADRLDNLTRNLAASFRRRLWRMPGVLYRMRQIARQSFERTGEYDLILSPVLGHATPELGYLSPELPFPELIRRLTGYVGFTPINNASGEPAISLPLAQSDEGLPIGVQLSARMGDERTLLEIAYELEQASPWHRITDR
ncbi:MAG: amidase [Planctomycetaceae bacterium]|nr:MAG: amidase [Planctomycetaceae bacterium]